MALAQTLPHEHIIDASELDNTLLIEVFNRAYIEAREDQDHDIVISTDSENFIYLEILEKLKLIHLSTFFDLNIKAEKLEKLEFINMLNHKVVFSRFSAPKEDMLAAEYFFSYKLGIFPHTLISTVRLFEEVTWSVLRKYDNKNLIG